MSCRGTSAVLALDSPCVGSVRHHYLLQFLPPSPRPPFFFFFNEPPPPEIYPLSLHAPLPSPPPRSNCGQLKPPFSPREWSSPIARTATIFWPSPLTP